MDKLQWIKDLVAKEQTMENAGLVDLSEGIDRQQLLLTETLDYLHDLKATFLDSVSAFNQLKDSSLGNIKIYGISKTKADFMLFRNGYKLIFTMLNPGEIGVSFNHMGKNFLPNAPKQSSSTEKDNSNHIIIAKWGAFGELNWNFHGHPFNISYMIKYYLTRFIQESSN